MKKINTYIIEKLKIDKNVNNNINIIGKLALLCSWTPTSKIVFSLNEIKEENSDYIMLCNDKKKYYKNPKWKGNKGGFQLLYAKTETTRIENHILLNKEAIKLLSDFLKYGDICAYCGVNYNLTKEDAEYMLKKLELDDENN